MAASTSEAGCARTHLRTTSLSPRFRARGWRRAVAGYARAHLRSALLFILLSRPWPWLRRPASHGSPIPLPYVPPFKPSKAPFQISPPLRALIRRLKGLSANAKTRRRACPRRVLAFSYAFLAISTSLANAAASFTARSASTLRFRSIPAFLRPLMKRE